MSFRKKSGQKPKKKSQADAQTSPPTDPAMPGIIMNDEEVSWNVVPLLEMVRMLNGDIPPVRQREYEKYGHMPLPPQGPIPQGGPGIIDRSSIFRVVNIYLRGGDSGDFSAEEVQSACMYALQRGMGDVTMAPPGPDPYISAFNDMASRSSMSKDQFDETVFNFTHALDITPPNVLTKGEFNMMVVALVANNMDLFAPHKDDFLEFLRTHPTLDVFFDWLGGRDFLLTSELDYLKREIEARNPRSEVTTKETYDIMSFFNFVLPNLVRKRREYIANGYRSHFKATHHPDTSETNRTLQLKRIHALFRMLEFHEHADGDIKTIVDAEARIIQDFILGNVNGRMVGSKTLESPFSTVITSSAYDPSITLSDQVITALRFLAIPRNEHFETTDQLMLWLSGEYQTAYEKPGSLDEVRFVEACVILQLDPRTVSFGTTYVISPHMTLLLSKWASKNYRTMSVSDILMVARQNLVYGDQYYMKLAVQPFERRERKYLD